MSAAGMKETTVATPLAGRWRAGVVRESKRARTTQGSIAQARATPKEKIRPARDAQVPLGAKMGSGWDVAHAALFLASDEARFITGVLLPVDGGQSARIG